MTAFLLLTSALMGHSAATSNPPLALHPDNPHYFLFRGQPRVLITSAEHYGAVLNLDFDYVKYLDTLHTDGLDLTRVFVGAYVEHHGAFNIARNTLAPAEGRFICPWARSDTPGYPNGGNKFDLTRWDDAYFARLIDFVAQASERGIVVEVNLFCPFYRPEQWDLSPMNPQNNVNDFGPVTQTGVYTLTEHGGLLAVQEAMSRKVVAELQAFDNVYYEVMNEPYARRVPSDWEHHIVDVIVDAEKGLAPPHLISLNIANKKAKVEDPHPAVSILNFHYAAPPDTVGMNYGLNRAIGDNETGFVGNDDAPYRIEAWAFILAGGALYNNLDYSFTVDHEDGTFDYPDTQPGGGSATLRRQLRLLKEFIHSFDFVNMRPDNGVVQGELPEGAHAWALVEAGQQYAIYMHGGVPDELVLALPPGSYQIEWWHPVSGERVSRSLSHDEGNAVLKPPAFGDELALRIVREP